MSVDDVVVVDAFFEFSTSRFDCLVGRHLQLRLDRPKARLHESVVVVIARVPVLILKRLTLLYGKAARSDANSSPNRKMSSTVTSQRQRDIQRRMVDLGTR